jgi:hypothetical protein
MILFPMRYSHQLKNLSAKRNNAQVSETNVPTKESFQTLDITSDPPESEGNVTAIADK